MGAKGRHGDRRDLRPKNGLSENQIDLLLYPWRGEEKGVHCGEEGRDGLERLDRLCGGLRR